MRMSKIGISLIVLVITIIVMIILAGVIILSLTENDILKSANKVRYFSDVKNFQDELEMYFVENVDLDSVLFQADDDSVTYDGTVQPGETITDVIPSLGSTDKYDGEFKVLNGRLAYKGEDTDRLLWSPEVGLEIIIEGEPEIAIDYPSASIVYPGTDVIYTLSITSTVEIQTIDLTGQIEVVDLYGDALVQQPTITIGTANVIAEGNIEVNITIDTDNLPNGSYKLKVKAGAVTNVENISNRKDKISQNGFEVDSTMQIATIITQNPTGWTSGNVTVTITYIDGMVTKQYSLDGTNWYDYTAPVQVSTNTTIYTRSTDLIGNENTANLTITNIDKTAPSVVAANGGATSSSVTVSAQVSDTGSGVNISSYQYSKDNGATWTGATSATSYTFTGLATETYLCKVKASDNVGNSATSSAVAISTDGLGTIIPTASPTGWTNGNVTVTISYPEELVTKQYSIDGVNWSNYNDPITVSTNTMVSAKGSDIAENEITATLTITNIDKTAPSISASNGGATSSSVTVSASASDTGGSGINTSSYQYSKDNGATWTTATNATSYTFNTLTAGTYQCKVKVLDNVGNGATSNAVSISTQVLGEITLGASPTGWTNGNVTVTITYPAEIVTRQYSLNGSTWNTYSSALVIDTNNTTVYAKGLDAGGNQTSQATLTVSNIDKINPTVTYGTNGGSGSSASTTVTIGDLGGSGINTGTLQYVWDTQNSTAPVSGWQTFTNESTLTKIEDGTYYLWVRASDNAGNSVTDKTDAFITLNLPIPTGFSKSTVPGETEVSTGLVIIDDTNGNEFVWVPVPVFANFARVEYFRGVSTSQYIEETWDGVSTTTESDKMFKSVQDNKGFYIARYEAGIDSITTITTSNHGTAQNGTVKPVSKPGKGTWNYIKWGTNAGNIANPGDGAVTVSRSMYNNSEIASTLIYGVQWDAALEFIKTNPSHTTYPTNSLNKGNHTGSLKLAGADVAYKVNNIYDMAGNENEFTMELHSTNFPSTRGGIYSQSGESFPAADRNYTHYANEMQDKGFRPVIYFK